MRGKPFEPGNKLGKGRAPGSRNKKTKLAESLESHGEAIIQQCKLLAMKGDPTALRLCVERLIPVAKPPATRFRLPKMETPADFNKVLLSVIQQTSKGRLSAFEAEALARVVDSHLRTIEVSEFDERLRAVEEDHGHPLVPVEEDKPLMPVEGDKP